MNLYLRKQRWKAVLLGIAVAIVGVSLWYSNFIVSQIKKEERLKVQIWSEAVRKRLQLINYTEELFESLRNEERQKIKLWAHATSRMRVADDSEMNLLREILVNNNTIPVMVVAKNNQLRFSRNIADSLINTQEGIDKLIAEMGATYDPIVIKITDDLEQKVYYKDSHIITNLEDILDDLINSFISETVMNTASVPVLVTDSSRTEVIRSGNIDSAVVRNPELLSRRISEMASSNEPIRISFGDHQVNYIFYEDSVILTQLRYYPVVQIIIIGLFLLIAYLIFSTFRNAEQNQVWIGLAKETAHQLGTPLSSLIGWVQLLELRGTDKETITEINKDINRLETITDRFSKIGSNPELQEVPVKETVEKAVNYLRPRVSSKVNFQIVVNQQADVRAKLNPPLFSWVVENICKNAVDAMNNNGSITIEISNEIQNVYIDISDTGKGIPGPKHRTIFQPGYTTKKRGWGLGLSLARRIIENYHNGKIFVKRSEPNKGTTFRIVLKSRN